MSVDSDFDKAMMAEDDPEKKHNFQLAVLLTHMRMANAQLAEYAVHQRTVNQEIQALKVSMTANTDVTIEVRNMLDTGKALFKLARWAGNVIRWCGYIAAAATTVYGAYVLLRHGHIDLK